MWLVNMSIPGDQFFDAMEAMSGWLEAEHVNTSHFSYSRDAAGAIKFRISFLGSVDADRFAERFDGRVQIVD
jgi:hypothetical protein